MDRKTILLKNKKWLAAMLCLLTVIVLGFAIILLEQVADASEMYVPSNPAGTTTVVTNPIAGATTAATQAATQPSVMPEPDILSKPVIPPQPLLPESLPQPPQPPKPTFLEYNTFKKKDFAKVNGYITCKTAECWLGVDVSLWQEDINWEKVAKAGVQFAMVRVGYRGWGRLARLREDPYWQKNLEGAAAAGLKVGVYFYSQATSVKEARAEAQYVLKLLDGRKLDMPVVFDWEVPAASDARTRNVKAKTIHACAMAFCEEIQAAGYRPMVYFNQWQGYKKYNLAELREAGYELWLAMYTKAMTYDYKVQMWQYTSNGRVPGIDGRVDINLYFPES